MERNKKTLKFFLFFLNETKDEDLKEIIDREIAITSSNKESDFSKVNNPINPKEIIINETIYFDFLPSAVSLNFLSFFCAISIFCNISLKTTI